MSILLGLTGCDSSPHSGPRRVHGRQFQNGNVSSVFIPFAFAMCPGIGSLGFRVALQVEHFYVAVPYSPALESLGNRYSLHMPRPASVELEDGPLQGLYVFGHCAMSTRSPTVQKLLVTPAAMAGVHFRVP